MKKVALRSGCCLFFAAFLTHCENLIPLESAPMGESLPTSQQAPNKKVGQTAAGLWGGSINYAVVNGTTFQTPMQVSVSPALDRVTTVAGQSDAETVAASRSGNSVSWSMLGPSMVTEVTLQPIQGGKAHVTSRVIENGKVLANGSGIFVSRG